MEYQQYSVATAAVPRRLSAPPGFLVVALAGMFAWAALSLLVPTGDFVEYLRRVRLADGLWPWVVLALFQLAGRKGPGAAWLRLGLVTLIGCGMALTAARMLLPLRASELRAVTIADAVMAGLVAAVTAVRGLKALAGRAVHVVDVWFFVALQWLLVWAAANVMIAVQKNAPSDPRILNELALLGAGAHVALLLAIQNVPAFLRVTFLDRASLVTLVTYNIGVAGVITGWPAVGVTLWMGTPLMVIGLCFYVLAVAPLLRSPARVVAALPLLVVAVLLTATTLRPFDNGAYAGWRHAAGGALGLTVLATLALDGRNSARHQLCILLGLAIYALGVATRVGEELHQTVSQTVHLTAALGSALEILGVLLAGAAAFLVWVRPVPSDALPTAV